MITSSSIIWAEYKFDDPYKYMKSQILFFLISIILMFFISKIDYKLYYKYANIIFLLSLLLMILVLIPGIGKVRNGSRSWFGIGGFGIQPSEFMKLSIIIFISKYISIKKFNLVKILILIFLVFV